MLYYRLMLYLEQLYIPVQGISSLSLVQDVSMLQCRLQELDSRNFFAWAYRRFITAKLGTPAQQEEQYTMGLINANFSDYSAWHARTVLLPQIHDAAAASAQQQNSAPAAVGTAEASG